MLLSVNKRCGCQIVLSNCPEIVLGNLIRLVSALRNSANATPLRLGMIGRARSTGSHPQEVDVEAIAQGETAADSDSGLTPEIRRLGYLSLAGLIVSGHYGMGFLLGTAESSAQWGAAGSLYPVALALGTLLFVPVARLYWQDVSQLWTLLGDRYGRFLQQLSSIMSWLAFTGVMAAQVAAGAAILSVLGVPRFGGTIGLTVILSLLSLLPLHRLSWVLRGLLLISLLALGTALVRLDGIPHYIDAPIAFTQALGTSVPWGQALGVFLTAAVTVPIDMKFQQFVVQGRSPATVSWSCLMAAVVVLALAFLPSAAVIAAQQSGILPEAITPRQIIPYVLGWLGGGVRTPLGILMVGTVLLPALGAGSTVLRIQTQLVVESLPSRWIDRGWKQMGMGALNAGLAMMLAFQGGSIIGVMVVFYAAYGAAVWWPFIAYVLERFGVAQLSPLAVQLSAGTAAIASVSTLVAVQLEPAIAWAESAELTVLLFGLGFGAIALLAGQTITLLGAETQQVQT